MNLEMLNNKLRNSKIERLNFKKDLVNEDEKYYSHADEILIDLNKTINDFYANNDSQNEEKLCYSLITFNKLTQILIGCEKIEKDTEYLLHNSYIFLKHLSENNWFNIKLVANCNHTKKLK